MPLSKRLTLRTSSAWSAGSRLRWMTPIPPASAIAIASLASVTVSIAAETIGRLRRMARVSRAPMSVALGIDRAHGPGRSSTSSNASPSGIKSASTIAIAVILRRIERGGWNRACVRRMARLPNMGGAKFLGSSSDLNDSVRRSRIESAAETPAAPLLAARPISGAPSFAVSWAACPRGLPLAASPGSWRTDPASST